MSSRNQTNILVTSAILSGLMDALEREYNVHKLWLAPDRAEFLNRHGPSIRGLVSSSGAKTRIDAALINTLPMLEIISNFGVGTDAIDLNAAKARNIIVTNTPNVLDDAVADTALALILAVTRRICAADKFVRAGNWPLEKFPLGFGITGKICGIAGLGNIGLQIARRASAFGMNIAYHNRNKRADVDYTYHASLKDLAERSDILVIATPGGAATKHLVNENILKALGPKGILINIARGSVVDEKALVKILQTAAIAGAGLDVFENEPHVPKELLTMENVVLLPHIGSATTETRAAMADLTFSNLHNHFTGKPVITKVE